MAKRPDNDSTMELSTSQLVPDQPDHDASVWGQVVVDSDQFAPQPAKATKPAAKPAAKAATLPEPEVTAPEAPQSRAALWIFLGFIAVAAIGAALIVGFAK